MEWIILSFLGAFGQALGWALKKKALDKSGVNNFIGFVSFGVASLALLLLYYFLPSETVILSSTFIVATLAGIVVNILAVWFGYKALDRGNLSVLMPYISLTALMIIPVEYVLRGILPVSQQLLGILSIVLGAIIMAGNTLPSRKDIITGGYFSVTLICYALGAPLVGLAVAESQSGIVTGIIMHAGIAIGFIPLVFLSCEFKLLKQVKKIGRLKYISLWAILAGIVIALLENGPVNIALETATASEVFSLKRTMPFFALLLGVAMFKEKVNLRHIAGTFLLVLGSVAVVWFRQ